MTGRFTHLCTLPTVWSLVCESARHINLNPLEGIVGRIYFLTQFVLRHRNRELKRVCRDYMKISQYKQQAYSLRVIFS